MEKKLIKSSMLVVSLTLLAKIIGFVKSIIQASYFGATMETDAFNVSNGFVSNILYMIATAVAVAFVPLYIKKNDPLEKKRFATSIITFFFIGSIVLTVLLIICAPLFIKIIAPSYDEQTSALAVSYFRVLVVGVVFSVGVNLYTNLLNAEKIYGYSTMCSIINSLVLIILILLCSRVLGVWTLVLSVPLSYFVQWVTLYFKGRKLGRISFSCEHDYSAIKLLAIQAIPILISQSSIEINQVVDRALLSSTGVGVVTAVSYSAILYQFASTLVHAPLSTVIFTELSIAEANSDSIGVKRLLNNSNKAIMIFCVPIVLVIFFCAKDIVSVVYGHGSFSDKAIDECSIGLMMYGMCLLPGSMKTTLSRAYYAANDTRRPMRLGILEVLLNITLSIILTKYFGIYGVIGATAIASFCFMIVMFIDYNSHYIKIIDIIVFKQYWKIGIASVLAIIIMCITNNPIAVNHFINLVIKSIIAFGAYWSVLIALKEDMFVYLLERIFKKIRH